MWRDNLLVISSWRTLYSLTWKGSFSLLLRLTKKESCTEQDRSRGSITSSSIGVVGRFNSSSSFWNDNGLAVVDDGKREEGGDDWPRSSDVDGLGLAGATFPRDIFILMGNPTSVVGDMEIESRNAVNEKRVRPYFVWPQWTLGCSADQKREHYCITATTTTTRFEDDDDFSLDF